MILKCELCKQMKEEFIQFTILKRKSITFKPICKDCSYTIVCSYKKKEGLENE